MDDLLALLEEDGAVSSPEPCEATDRSSSHKAARRSSHRPSANARAPPAAAPPSSPPAASVDAKTGIRMLNRRIAGDELLDLIESYPYHSAAAIAAMSTAALNRLLLEPAAAVLDRTSTVCGATNLATVAVVLGSSGTKISTRTGSAYCLLTLGGLTTGPAVSVMLFGAAYSALCRACAPGRVVLLLCPRLAPQSPEPGGPRHRDTTVLFTVQNPEQCRLVADARDFGRCQARVGRPPPAPGAVAEPGADEFLPKQCRNVIDKRQGDYCPYHRKQAQKKASAKRGGNRLDRLVAESQDVATQRSLAHGRTMVLPGGTGKTMTLPSHPPSHPRVGNRGHPVPPSKSDSDFGTTSTAAANRPRNSILNPPVGRDRRQQTVAAVASSSRPTQSMAPPRAAKLSHNSILNPSSAAVPAASARAAALPHNSILNPTSTTAAATARLANDARTSIGRPLSLTTAAASGPSKSGVQKNPYCSARPSCPDSSASRAAADQRSGKENGGTAEPLTDWLHPKKHRGISLGSGGGKPSGSGTSKRVNLDTGRHHGTVLVPRPRPALLGAAAAAAAVGDRARSRRAAPAPRERSADAILRQQQVAAEQLRQSEPLRQSAPPRPAWRRPATAAPGEDPRAALLFGDIPDEEAERFANAKSKYDREAAAEEYTRSRNRLIDLDQEEHKFLQRKEKNRAGDGPIEKTWHCKDCNQTFRTRPLPCQRRGHVVKQRWSIQEETKTRDEQRQALSETTDGLVLGQGLEWSRWNEP